MRYTLVKKIITSDYCVLFLVRLKVYFVCTKNLVGYLHLLHLSTLYRLQMLCDLFKICNNFCVAFTDL